MNDLQFMPHQEEVLNLTDDKNRCAYYLDMGLGKTFVGAEKMYLLNNTINLIVCQKSKIDDWVDHIKTYYPEYRVMDLTKKSEGVNFRTLVETKDLYDQNIQIVGVINYDLVFRRKYIAHITDFTLLLDESSLICNENAKRSKFILKLQPESVILLSGTPTAGKGDTVDLIVDGVEVMKVITREEFNAGIKRLAQENNTVPADAQTPAEPLDGAMNPPEQHVRGQRRRRTRS